MGQHEHRIHNIQDIVHIEFRETYLTIFKT